VKINAYTASDEDAVAVAAILESQFEAQRRPAFACVTTPLRHPGSRVALDVIAAVGQTGRRPNGASAGFLKLGPRVFISGQAEKGDGTMAGATRKTMESLGRTLDFLGLQKSNVVQVKCFLNPMGAVPEAEREIAAWFGPGEVTPGCPVSFVEWQSPLPVEIEMVVSAPDFGHGPSVEVRTPPGMTTPAVYSRVTIVRHSTLVYIGGLYPASNVASPAVQLRSLFSRLKQCLDVTGSDWTHLVKATYYVSDESLSKEHNVVRPDYFSPRRPPAASKANVRGVGLPGHGISMDFIAVPGEP
jgi:enamine deaminase RidA (YjgF/YER057c/UK114 family)